MATPAAEALPARPVLRENRRVLGELLRPEPGRLEFAVRLALVCTISAGMAEWFQTPEPALTAYLGFFLLRADRLSSIAISAALLALASVLLGLVAWMANGLIGRPTALLATMTLIAFALFFLTSASKLAPVGGILGLVTTFALSLVGRVPDGELATRALLYGWLMAGIPVGVSIVINLLVGPAPRRLAERALSRRLAAAAAVLRRGDAASRDTLRELRTDGVAEIEKWLRQVALEQTSAPQDIAALRHACHATTRVLLLMDLLDAHMTDTHAREAVADVLDGMAGILMHGGYPVEIELPAFAGAGLPPLAGQALAALRSTLAHFADAEPSPLDPDPPTAFLAADAFSNPMHPRFALKATGAAMFCYLLYNALGWQGIHTAFITCFIVALGTAGETVQKLSLRIAGCLVGAAAGVAVLLWVLPNVHGLPGLLALLFVLTLGASWVAAGSPRIAYAGFQIAFAFYLCVLQGSGPSYDLAVARDRVIGILIGNVVIYFVFTRLWPVSVAQRVDRALAALLHRLARVAEAPDTYAAGVQASRADAARGAIAADLALLGYEPPSVRPPANWIALRRRTLARAAALAAPLTLESGDASVALTLDALAQRLDGRQIAAARPSPPAAPPRWLARPLQQLTDSVLSQTARTHEEDERIAHHAPH